MTVIPEPEGVPCDFCQEYAAVMSIMNLSDYSQMKPCGNCAPAVLRGIADMFDPPQTPPAGGESEPAAAPSDDAAASLAGTPAGGTPDDPGPDGSAADHWASTTNVRRSTHGHRTPASRTRKPRQTDTPPPEGTQP